MSATNLTKNLKLSQFVASDKPSWLGDVNGDNKKIDDGYGVLAGEISKANDTASSAKSQSDANTQTLTNVNSELEDHGNRITALEAGGGTEQLEQRVNTLSTDVEALQTRADTFEENISQNGTDITALKGRVDTIEPKVKSNYDNITSLSATTNELSETVQRVNTSTLALQSDMTNVKSRLSSTETTASNAFNKSQDNASRISTLANQISDKTSLSVTTLALTDTPNGVSSTNVLALWDGVSMVSLILPLTFGLFNATSAGNTIGKIDLSGIIPDIASKNILLNNSTLYVSNYAVILEGTKPQGTNEITLSLRSIETKVGINNIHSIYITSISVY